MSSEDALSDQEDRHPPSRPSQKPPSRPAVQEELSNTDQISLINTLIDSALEHQRKSFIEHLDQKISGPKTETVPVDDFEFQHEGNKIQYKFNKQRSDKLSDISRLIRSGKIEVS